MESSQVKSACKRTDTCFTGMLKDLAEAISLNPESAIAELDLSRNILSFEDANDLCHAFSPSSPQDSLALCSPYQQLRCLRLVGCQLSSSSMEAVILLSLEHFFAPTVTILNRFLKHCTTSIWKPSKALGSQETTLVGRLQLSVNSGFRRQQFYAPRKDCRQLTKSHRAGIG